MHQYEEANNTTNPHHAILPYTNHHHHPHLHLATSSHHHRPDPLISQSPLRQSSTHDDLTFQYVIPTYSSPSSPERDSFDDNDIPPPQKEKDPVEALRKELEPVHYEFGQFSKDLVDTFDKLRELQLMAIERDEEQNEFGKHWGEWICLIPWSSHLSDHI